MADIRKTERTLKALANKRRLEIVKYLEKSSVASVGTIAEAIKLSFKSTSRHLAVLSNADLLDRTQTSTTVLYKLADTPSAILKTTLRYI